MIRKKLEGFAKFLFPHLKTENEIKEIVSEKIKEYRTKAALPIVANYDPKNEGYRPLASYSAQRNLASIDQDRMVEIAYFMFDNSAMFKRLAKLDKSFLFGEPITIEAQDKNVQELINEFWNDSLNLMNINFPDNIMWLSILGEQIWPVEIEQSTGIVHLGYVDPQDIKDVYVYRYNRRKLAKIELRDESGKKGRKLRIIQRNQNPADKPGFGRLTGDCFYWSINHPPNAPRGRSDFLTLFDWIDALERYGFNYLERAEFMLNFVWDVTLKGKNEEEIRVWLKDNPPPEPGSVRAHNENAEWNAVSPKLEAHDFTGGFRELKGFVLGSVGRPENWYGSGGKVYSSESELMGQVPIKDLDDRQRLIKHIVERMIDFQIDQGIIFGRLSQGVNREFEVNMPEISKKDLAKIAAVLPQITASLDLAEGRAWVTNETATKFYLAALQQCGMDIDIEKEINELEKQAKAFEEEQRNKIKQQPPEGEEEGIGFHSPQFKPEQGNGGRKEPVAV